MRGAWSLCAAAALLAACGGKPVDGGSGDAPRTAADSAAADLMTLGTEISRLLDLADDYRGSHHGAGTPGSPWPSGDPKAAPGPGAPVT
jgi:hypothetical protein